MGDAMSSNSPTSGGMPRPSPSSVSSRPTPSGSWPGGVSSTSRVSPPLSTQAQLHAATHAAWFAQIPGTPGHTGDADRTRAMLTGMANLYASNPDFHPVFGGADAASFAAEALRHHAQRG